ncbi:hypothetical protein JCM6882_005129 [Rhodosporidiobolus microsporus]
MNRYGAAPPPARGPPRPAKVDREKTCPSLLRVFVKNGAHHLDTDFIVSSLPTADEHQLYTWRDTTLREILLLLRDADAALRPSPTSRFSLRLVFWDADNERFRSEELAVIAAKDLLPSSGGGAAASRGNYSNPRLDRTLADAKFVVGDYLSVAHLGLPAPIPVPAPAAPPVGFGGRPLGPRGPGPAGGGSGPQYAQPPHLRGGPGPSMVPGGGRGGFGGGPGLAGPRGPPQAGRRDDTWAPVQRGAGGGGRGGFNEGGRPAADQGWGRRRPSGNEQSEDRPPPPRRRDSRSRSPARRRSPSYTRSPPPRRDSRDDVDMRD